MGRVTTRLLVLISATSSPCALQPRDFPLGVSVVVQNNFSLHLGLLLLIMQVVELLLGLQEGTLRLNQWLAVRWWGLLTCWNRHTTDDVHEVLGLLPALGVIAGELLLLL